MSKEKVGFIWVIIGALLCAPYEERIASLLEGGRFLKGHPDRKYKAAREILALIKQEGYLHPSDVVEGWYILKYDTHSGGRGLRPTPATLQDILDGEAVKNDRD